MIYKESTIYCAVEIKVLSGGTVSCIPVSSYDVINTTNNNTAFPELRELFEGLFEIKLQEEYVLKYLNFSDFSVLSWFHY